MRGAPHLGLLGALLAGGCATAGSGNGPEGTDAAPHADAGIDGRPDAPADLCTTAATCQAAIDLGSVSGDTGSAMVMASGYQAAWYRVRVTENDSGITGIKLSFTAQLTSPAATHYDVFVYLNTGSDVIECTTPTGTPTTTGTTVALRVRWGEGTFSNGNDDGRSVAIEVRPSGTSCAPAQPWQLVIVGDT